MSEKYKKICKYLNYVERKLILASRVTDSLSISAFSLLVAILVGITSFAVKIKIRAITAGFEKYKLIIKKKKKKHDKIMLLRIDKLDSIEVLIYKGLINSYISHDKSVSVNNVLGEYYEMREEIKNPETSVEYIM